MHGRVKPDELTVEQKELLTSPYGFAKYFLGLPIMDTPVETKVGECRGSDGQVFYEIFENDRQRRMLDAVGEPNAKVTGRTCNGAGKTTTLIPGAVLWFMTVHPRAKVVITSGAERQVRAQIFPALTAHRRKLDRWQFTDNTITAPNGSTAIGFSTNEGGRFEGWHGNKDPFYDLLQHDGPLMIVLDEGKSIADSIFDAVDRCTYQVLLLLSSCGGASGGFYRSHTSQAKFYTHRDQIAASHCPHVDHEKNRILIEKRGLSDPLVRSKVFAEFMGEAAGAVIHRAWVETALLRPPAFAPGERRLFCDFAAGGDENAIGERNGNRARLVAAWRERDTMRACGQFIDWFRKLGITPETCPQIVAGDEGGLGRVIIDRLAEIGWVMQRVNNGAKARDAHYKNVAAETWFEAGKAFEQGRVLLDPSTDDVTIAQLTDRQGFAASNGVLEIESKEDMRERGLSSPDRADAIVGAMRTGMRIDPVPFMGTPVSEMGLYEQMMEESGLDAIPGAFAGN